MDILQDQYSIISQIEIILRAKEKTQVIGHSVMVRHRDLIKLPRCQSSAL